MVHINFLSPSLKGKQVKETCRIPLKARKGAKTPRLGNSLFASLRLCAKFFDGSYKFFITIAQSQTSRRNLWDTVESSQRCKDAKVRKFPQCVSATLREILYVSYKLFTTLGPPCFIKDQW
tara:strand:- start:735 stop:1097 length:363 start_codon:yes stop_codon:yes gene_type:complete